MPTRLHCTACGADAPHPRRRRLEGEISPLLGCSVVLLVQFFALALALATTTALPRCPAPLAVPTTDTV
jgi:hypothetical protein